MLYMMVAGIGVNISWHPLRSLKLIFPMPIISFHSIVRHGAYVVSNCFILFPFLAVCFKKNQKLLMLFILLLVLTVCGMYFTPEENIKGYWYVNPIARIPDFIVGMLLFRFYTYLIDKKMTYRTGTLLEISSIVIFLFFYLYAADVPKVYRYTCYYWFPVALLLLSFSLQKGFVSRLLSNRFLIIGGEISYSFYLIHLFVLLSYAEWQKEVLPI